MKKIIVSALFCCISYILSAQEESKSLQIKSANIQLGLYSNLTPVSNLSDFQKLAPNTKFQESDIVGFNSQNSASYANGPAFSMNLVLAKPKTEKLNSLNTEFRFGISYQQADLLFLGYNKKDEFRVDTLTSSRSGKKTFIDSIYTQDYYLNYAQRQVMFDADVLISTSPSKRFKFYGGIGLSLGLSIVPQTTIDYRTTSRLEQEEVGIADFESKFESDGEVENYRNDGGFFGRVYLPLGLDFRISKKNESWINNYHIFLETRPSLNFQSVPELNSLTTTANVSTLGLRYDF